MFLAVWMYGLWKRMQELHTEKNGSPTKPQNQTPGYLAVHFIIELLHL